MIVGNFKIITVCANEIEYGLYGDIYTNLKSCKKEHPFERILYGFYCERIYIPWYKSEDECEESPDWFNTLEEAINWAETHE